MGRNGVDLLNMFGEMGDTNPVIHEMSLLKITNTGFKHDTNLVRHAS